MTDQHNPFAAPASDVTDTPAERAHWGDASKGQRLANLFLDYVGFLIFAMAAGVVIALVGGDQAIDDIPDQIFGIGIMMAYYVLFESLTGRTLGKLLTGTKVVSEAGGPPGVWKVLGRTLSRFVPFEAFSFLGDAGAGWHDSWSGTRVVRLRPSKMQKEMAALDD